MKFSRLPTVLAIVAVLLMVTVSAVPMVNGAVDRDVAVNPSAAATEYGTELPTIEERDNALAELMKAMEEDNDLKDMVSILKSMFGMIPFFGTESEMSFIDNKRVTEFTEDLSNLSSEKIDAASKMMKIVAAYLMSNDTIVADSKVISDRTDVVSGESFVLSGDVSFTGNGQVVVHAGGCLYVSSNFSISSTTNINHIILEEGSLIAFSADATEEDKNVVPAELRVNVSNKLEVTNSIDGDKTTHTVTVSGHVTINDELEIYGEASKPVVSLTITVKPLSEEVVKQIEDYIAAEKYAEAVFLFLQSIVIDSTANMNITSITVKSLGLTVSGITGEFKALIENKLDISYKFEGKVLLGIDGSDKSSKISGNGHIKLNGTELDMGSTTHIDGFELNNDKATIKFGNFDENFSLNAKFATSDKRFAGSFTESVKFNDGVKLTLKLDKGDAVVEVSGTEVVMNAEIKEGNIIFKENENHAKIGKIYVRYVDDNNLFEMRDIGVKFSGDIAVDDIIEFIIAILDPESEIVLKAPSIDLHADVGFKSMKFRLKVDEVIGFSLDINDISFGSENLSIKDGRISLEDVSYYIGSYDIKLNNLSKKEDRTAEIFDEIGISMKGAYSEHLGTIDIDKREADASYINNIDYFKVWIDNNYIEMKNVNTTVSVKGSYDSEKLDVTYKDTANEIKAHVMYREKSYITIDMKNSDVYQLFNVQSEDIIKVLEMYEEDDYIGIAFVVLNTYNVDNSYVKCDLFSFENKTGNGKAHVDMKNFKFRIQDMATMENVDFKFSVDAEVSGVINPSIGDYTEIKTESSNLGVAVVIGLNGIDAWFAGDYLKISYRDYWNESGYFEAKKFKLVPSEEYIYGATFTEGSFDVKNMYMSDLFGFGGAAPLIIFGEKVEKINFEHAYMEGILIINTPKEKVTGSVVLPAELANSITVPGYNIDLGFSYVEGEEFFSFMGYYLDVHFNDNEATLVPAIDLGIVAFQPYPDGSDTVPYTLTDKKSGDVEYTLATLGSMKGWIFAPIDRTKSTVYTFELGNTKDNKAYGQEVEIQTPEGQIAYIDGDIYANGETFIMPAYDVKGYFIREDVAPSTDNGKITTSDTALSVDKAAIAAFIAQYPDNEEIPFVTKNATVTISPSDASEGVVLDVEAFSKDTAVTQKQINAFAKNSNMVCIVSFSMYTNDGEGGYLELGDNLWDGAWIKLDNIAIPDGFDAKKDLVISYIDENGRTAYVDEYQDVEVSKDGKTCSVVVYVDHLCDYGVSFEKEAPAGDNSTLIIVLVVVVVILIIAIAGFAIYKKKNSA